MSQREIRTRRSRENPSAAQQNSHIESPVIEDRPLSFYLRESLRANAPILILSVSFFLIVLVHFLLNVNFEDLKRELASRRAERHIAQVMASRQLSHVIIVGGGLAGLSATAESLIQGSRVTLIDKGRLGGNSAKATSGMNGAVTKPQKDAGIDGDSIGVFYSDIMRSGQGESDPRLAHVLAARSASAVHFLIEEVGLNLTDVNVLGGHSVPRTHRLKPKPDGSPAPVGFSTISALKKYIGSSNFKDSLVIRENCSLRDLTFDMKDGVLMTTGVKVQCGADQEMEKITADAVILAAGGFAADLADLQNSILARVCPKAKQVGFTTNGAFATGDVHKIALNHSIDTIHLGNVQLHPTGFIDPKAPLAREKFLCPEVMRGVGGILLNQEGQRFVDELSRRDQVTEAIERFGTPIVNWKPLNMDNQADGEENPTDSRRAAALLLNNRVRDRVGAPTFDFYKAKGFIRETGSVESTCALLGCESKALKTTLEEYEAAAQKSATDRFGKSTFPEVFDPEGSDFFVAFVTPAVHYCMGGLKVNAAAQVSQKGRIIPNLFAVGELAGGLHGKNRLGGNGMLEAVVFGRVAGKLASHILATQWNSEKVISLEIRDVQAVPPLGLLRVTLNLPSVASPLDSLPTKLQTLVWRGKKEYFSIKNVQVRSDETGGIGGFSVDLKEEDVKAELREKLIPGEVLEVLFANAKL